MEDSGNNSESLRGVVALVAGATRGGGRGIAIELGARLHAKVYCSGRSVVGHVSDLNRPETIQQTAELVTAAGGEGIAVRCDHSDMAQVQALVQRIEAENPSTGITVLVNCVWGCDAITEWGKPFWECDIEQGFKLLHRAIETHLLTSRFVLPAMVKRRAGLVVEIGDGDDLTYRGNFYYDMAKTTLMRVATSMNAELRPHKVAIIYLTPGFLRSEAMLEQFGVTEPTWKEAIAKDKFFAESETPHFLGRAVAALASDPNVLQKGGERLATWTLAREYGFDDIDGRRPHWKEFFERTVKEDGVDPRDNILSSVTPVAQDDIATPEN